jgi:5-methylcytosine-specific restriction endonuclease McrBC GTP-binding regulatory subunit McrB
MHTGYWWESQKERKDQEEGGGGDNIKIDLREIDHGEPSGSLKCWEVPEWLHNWQLLRKGPAP